MEGGGCPWTAGKRRNHTTLKLLYIQLNRLLYLICSLTVLLSAQAGSKADFPRVTERAVPGYFPLVANGQAVSLVTDANDHKVVSIATHLLADDVERVTDIRPSLPTATSIRRLP